MDEKINEWMDGLRDPQVDGWIVNPSPFSFTANHSYTLDISRKL